MGGVCAKVHVARDEGVAPSKPGAGGVGVGDGAVGLGRVEREVFPMPGLYDSGELRLFDSGKFKARPAGSAAHSRTGSSMVPEFGSLLGRAGTVSLGKAVEVLDTLGSSMSNLNPSGSFISGMAARKTKLTILAFEVANTIVKGSYLMQSFSEENIRFVKNEVLLSDGVRRLVSTDMEELLTIAGADKKEELDIFSREVVRFGNLCKDPQWHNLGRYFRRLNSDFFLHKMQKEDAERTMQQLVTMAQHTSELYHELHALDRLEQDYHSKAQEEAALNVARRGEDLMILHSEVKRQRRIVKSLQKKSLWSKNLEEIIGELADIVTFLNQELIEAFGSAVFKLIEDGTDQHPNRLGPCGLALHYANVINQIDNIVARPSSIPPNTRDTLYHALPSSVKVALRARLQSFSSSKELTVAEIKAEMEKTLHWIVPMASNTMKAHQGFGWVGEWANMGNYFDKKTSNNVLRIQTLHHALNDKTDEHILELVTWLHQLVIQAKHRNYGLRGFVQQQLKTNNITSPAPVASVEEDGHGQDPSKMSNKSIRLTEEEEKLLEGVNSRRFIPGLSRSQGSGCTEKRGNMEIGQRRRCNSFSIARSSSKISTVEYGRTRDLDVMDGLQTLLVSNHGQSI